MELKWLEDFLTLVESGNFSKAAARRNVTQPAFSRRIQRLEDWLDVRLVDRGKNPVRLLPNAVRFVPHVRQLVAQILELQNDIRQDEESRKRITIASQHTLTVTLFPQLLHALNEAQLGYAIRLRSVNRKAGEDLLRDGEADMLLCYDTPPDRVDLMLPGLERAELGRDRLVPVSTVGLNNGERYARHGPLAMLHLPKDSHLGSVIERECLRNLLERYAITVVCISAFTVGIKAMALAGMGAGWLPESLVRREIMQGQLLSLEDDLDTADLSIGLYRYPGPRIPETVPIWNLLTEWAARPRSSADP